MLKVKAVFGVCAMFTVAAEKCHDVEKVVGEEEKVKEEKVVGEKEKGEKEMVQ